MPVEVTVYLEGRIYLQRRAETSLDRAQSFLLQIDELDAVITELQAAKEKVITLKRAEAAKLTAEADQLETKVARRTP